ncbi:MAG: hypothetical protein U0Y68_03745 [Blastocatellia bacterium]
MKATVKIIAATAVFGLFLATAFRTEAYPPFVRKSEKFGAKDCLFCHTEPNGGEGWNDRGKWLIAEKDKRKADSIDVEWLTDYKPVEGEKKDGEGEKKDGEKKEGEKKPEEKKKNNGN